MSVFSPKELLKQLISWFYEPAWAKHELDEDLRDHLDPNNPFQIELGVGD